MKSPYSPFVLAREAQHLARNAGTTDGVIFQKVATVTMCVVGVSSAMHVLNELYRTLHPEERQRGRSR